MTKWFKKLIDYYIKKTRRNLRDDIAMNILPFIWEGIDIKPQNCAFESYATETSKAAYVIADAMVKAKGKK